MFRKLSALYSLMGRDSSVVPSRCRSNSSGLAVTFSVEEAVSTSWFSENEPDGMFGSSIARNSPVALFAPVFVASVAPRCTRCLVTRARILGSSLCIKPIAVQADSYVLSKLPSSTIIISHDPR